MHGQTKVRTDCDWAVELKPRSKVRKIGEDLSGICFEGQLLDCAPVPPVEFVDASEHFVLMKLKHSGRIFQASLADASVIRLTLVNVVTQSFNRSQRDVPEVGGE
jgi:hypothetical protein